MKVKLALLSSSFILSVFSLEPFQEKFLETHFEKELSLGASILTAETFQHFADHKFEDEDLINSTLEISHRDIKRGDFVFVPTMRLFRYLKHIHPKIEQPYFLISTHNDRPTFAENEIPFLDDPKILALISINNERPKHPKSIPIPYGCPSILALGKRPKYFPDQNKYLSLLKEMPKRKIFVFNVYNLRTHPYREDVFQALKNKDFIDVRPTGKTNRIYPEQYLELLASSVFCVSPRGNGVDCFRHWESMLLGTIPIIETSILDGLFHNLPALIVKDLCKIKKKDLDTFYRNHKLCKSGYKYEKLFPSYWLTFLKKLKRLAQNNLPIYEEIKKFKKETYGFEEDSTES